MSTITDSRTTTQILDGTSELLKVTRQGSVNVSLAIPNAYGIWDQGSHNKIVVDGSIRAITGSGTEGRGIFSDGTDLTVVVGKFGTLQGYDAIDARENTLVRNSGHIDGLGVVGYGVHARTGAEIQNERTGNITGAYGIYIEGAAEIRNSGTIQGSIAAVYIASGTGEESEIVNHALIKGGAPTVVVGGNGNEHIINDGKIIGDIRLSAGADTVDTRGGTIKGEIDGGAGDDILITDSKKHLLTELNASGSDTVKSTVSYTLSDYVETLTLLGKKNINGTGTDSTAMDNYLYGNAGKNVLNGLGGYNELFGKGGTDTLIGGANYDLFGIGKHYGRDTVKGFQDGVDQIDIYRLGPDSFDELKSHIKDHGNDTWIDFGKDVLILKGVDHSLLGMEDFIYNY